MSIPQEDLSQFLTELTGRRRRLLELVDSDPDSALVDELRTLGEQLIVADEELRVQREELDDTRRQVETLQAERSRLFSTATEAWVLTDEHGVVLRSTRAADLLVRRPAARMTPRPIATWFDLPDRALIRRMVGRASQTETQVLEQAVLRRSDDSLVGVRVTLTRTVGAPGERAVLRWELGSAPAPAPAPAPVRPDLAGRPAGVPDPRLHLDLVVMSTRLAQRLTVAEARAVIVADVARMVPAADHVGLVLYQRRAPGQPVASSDPTAALADQAQLELGGPLTVTLAEDRATRLADVQSINPWPAFAARADSLGLRGALAVPLMVPSPLLDPGTPARPVGVPNGPPPTAELRVGALTLYARRPGVLDDGAELAASLAAAHGAAALVWANREASLQDALLTRQQIGEAVGVLAERHRITPATAFETLLRRSQNANLKLRDLARIVVETGQEPAEITSAHS